MLYEVMLLFIYIGMIGAVGIVAFVISKIPFVKRWLDLKYGE